MLSIYIAYIALTPELSPWQSIHVAPEISHCADRQRTRLPGTVLIDPGNPVSLVPAKGGERRNATVIASGTVAFSFLFSGQRLCAEYVTHALPTCSASYGRHGSRRRHRYGSHPWLKLVSRAGLLSLRSQKQTKRMRKQTNKRTKNQRV